jgi:hypothetical protein
MWTVSSIQVAEVYIIVLYFTQLRLQTNLSQFPKALNPSPQPLMHRPTKKHLTYDSVIRTMKSATFCESST